MSSLANSNEQNINNILLSPNGTHGYNLEQLMNGYYTPLTDIKETSEYMVIHIELPGVSIKDIDIEVGDGTLDVRGEHNEETKYKNNTLTTIRKERIYGKFKKTIPIDSCVSGQDVRASFKEGLLIIEISKPKKHDNSKKQKVKLF